MSAIAKRHGSISEAVIHAIKTERSRRRLDALERAAKLVEKWRKEAAEHGFEASWTKSRCASELQEALEGE